MGEFCETFDLTFAKFGMTNASLSRAARLVALGKWLSVDESFCPTDQSIGVGQEEMNSLRELGSPRGLSNLGEVVGGVCW